MRDVANQTARGAIDQHVSRITIQAACWKFFLSAVSVMSGIGLLYVRRPSSNLSVFGASVAFVVSAFWLLRGLYQFRIAQRRLRLQALSDAAHLMAHTPAASAVNPDAPSSSAKPDGNADAGPAALETA
jgi:hypothetical protein